MAPDVQELTGGLEPEALVLENARRKAMAVRSLVPRGSVVLGVDTEVFVAGRALGKPADGAAAERSLRTLSGQTHTVLSGVCLLDGEGAAGAERERSGSSESRVGFRALDEGTIGVYLASGEWRDRAGGYAIQGLGSILIERVEGDFSNVVGLPLRLLLALAPELGRNPNPNV